MNNPKKILIVRLGAIGDVVFTTIMPYAIKQKYPDCVIHYVAQKDVVGLLENNPYIDKIYPWDRVEGKHFKYIKSVAKILREEKYDVIFNFNNTLKTFLLSFLSFPKKIVPKRQYGGLWVEDFFLAAKSVFKDIEKPCRLYLGLNENTVAEVDEMVKNFSRPYFVFCPGGATNKNRAGRSWDIDNWHVLSKKLMKEFGGTVFVCGSSSEVSLHSKLACEGVVVLSGQLELDKSGALLSKADLVVSGDTGPLHMASAYNVKTLALLGSTSPDRIKPYGENGYWISSDYECKYCWKKKCKFLKGKGGITPCMETLTADKVFDKIKEIFSLSVV